jgi:hypothetical protein
MNGWRGGKRIEDWGVIHKAIQMCAEITVSGVKRRSIVNDCKKDSKKRNVPISSEHLFMKSGSVCELHHVIHELHICSNMSVDHNSTYLFKRTSERETYLGPIRDRYTSAS